MDKNKISVIVPVYKVEQYLDKCVQSIVDQTYKNLEIILVDDGSPDKCPAMCDEWAKKDSRIKVIHKENGGVSSARNAGIDSATGEFVAFVDSDDYLAPTMYEKLIDAIKKEDCDISMCGFIYLYEDGLEKPIHEINAKKVTGGNIVKYLLANTCEEKQNYIETYGLMGNVWRILIKKEIIGKIRFEKLKIAEDMLFLLKIINKNTKITAIDDALYYYLQRTSSVMHVFNKEKVAQRYGAFKIILDVVKDRASDAEINAFKFYNYASIVNELLKNKQFDLLNEYLNDSFFISLNSKENYKAECKNIKNIKRKIGYFLVHKKMFKLYANLVSKI